MDKKDQYFMEIYLNKPFLDFIISDLQIIPPPSSCLHDCIISLRGKVWAHETNLTPPLFIEVPVPCICVLREWTLPLFQSVPKTFWKTSSNSILEEFFSIWLRKFYAIFTRLGHKAGGFWHKLLPMILFIGFWSCSDRIFRYNSL